MGDIKLKSLSIFNKNQKNTLSPSKLQEYKGHIGKKINSWTIRDIIHVQKGMRRCLAECECGNIYERDLKSVLNGHSTQCTSCCAFKNWTSCERKPNHISKKARRTFYDAERYRSMTPEFRCWNHLRDRCYSKKNLQYPNYGGRGIKICDRWLDSYDHFLEDMGNKPTLMHSLDRIDVNGNYCKENCRWATPKEQAQNKRKVKVLFEENQNLKKEIECLKNQLDELSKN